VESPYLFTMRHGGSCPTISKWSQLTLCVRCETVSLMRACVSGFKLPAPGSTGLGQLTCCWLVSTIKYSRRFGHSLRARTFKRDEVRSLSRKPRHCGGGQSLRKPIEGHSSASYSKTDQAEVA
jgi:hypothetical protein